MRYLIFIHVAVAAICAMFSLADRGLLLTHAISSVMYEVIGVLIGPCLVALFVLPCLVLLTAIDGGYSFKQIVIGVTAEAVAVLGQFLALAPACM